MDIQLETPGPIWLNDRMQTEQQIRDLYRDTILASIGPDCTVAFDGNASLLIWTDADGKTATYIGVADGEPHSGRRRLRIPSITIQIMAKALANAIALGAAPANLHPYEIGGVPEGYNWTDFETPPPRAPQHTQTKLSPQMKEVLTEFMGAIDIAASECVPDVYQESGEEARAGGSYEELRRTKGILREIMQGWPYMFCSAYCMSGPILEIGKPAEYHAALLFKRFTASHDVDMTPSKGMIEVMRRIRGLHSSSDYSDYSTGIGLAANLDVSWLPPTASQSAAAIAEWNALFDLANILEAENPGTGTTEEESHILAGLIPAKPPSWRQYLETVKTTAPAMSL